MNLRMIECQPGQPLDDKVLAADEPILLRGLVAHWPLVRQAARSNAEAATYLQDLYGGRPVTLVQGDADISGRIAYSADLASLNCQSTRQSLPRAVQKILGEAGKPQPRLFYMGTTLTSAIMPAFRQLNDLELAVDASQYIWMGNRSCIPAHYDLPDNLACNVVGRRRFTLFPPEQLQNLYVGPLDFTPAGQAISLVDIRNPDLEKYPRYAEAQQHARVAELEPGDALFLPSMWWHNVEGLDDFNVLINYWWRRTPNFLSSPADVLDLALLSIRCLPEHQKKIWKQMLDYYVFNDDETAFEHIPQAARGCLGNIDATLAKQIRARVLSRLNR